MNCPKLGKAFITNNVASTNPGSMVDVHELEATYQHIGFEVFTYLNCTKKVIFRNISNYFKKSITGKYIFFLLKFDKSKIMTLHN